MTADEFRARYALLDPLAEGGVRTFHAVTPTGGVVMVHFVDGGITPENLALLSALERLEPERRALVREVTAVDGSIAVVTERLPDFRTLPAWLGLDPADPAPAPSDPAPSPSAPPPPPAPADSAAPVDSVDSTAPAASAVPAVWIDPPAPADAADRSGPAEAPAAADADPFAAPASSASAESAPPSADPFAAPPAPGGAYAPPEPPPMGEFTRLFMAADLSGAPAFSQPAQAPAPPATQPGEFTRLFRAGDAAAAGGAAGPSPAPAPPPPAARREETPPGPPPLERTEEARPPAAAPEVSPPEGSRGRTDELATFRAVSVPPAEPAREAPPPPTEPLLAGSPPAPGGPGGATGVFSAPPPLADPPPADSPPAEGGLGGATGVFSAPPPQSQGQGGGAGGELTGLFNRLDLPAWTLPGQGESAAPPSAGSGPSTGPAAPEPLRFEREPEPPAAADDDYLERLLSSPEPRYRDEAPLAPPPAEAPAPSAAPLPPAFGTPAPFPAAAPPPPAPAPAPPQSLPSAAPPRAGTPLLVGLVVTLVLALVLVLFFVLR